MLSKTRTINICSGKGGTGKTLIAITLAQLLSREGAKVLLIDADFFVRGLTYLLHLYNKRRRVTEKAASIDILSGRAGARGRLGIERYLNFDILPSVATIDEFVEFSRIDRIGIEQSTEAFIGLFDTLEPHGYDYIIVDTRAGADSISLGCSRASNITIIVSEDDPIAQLTMRCFHKEIKDYIMQQSVGDSRKSTVYTLLNKVRRQADVLEDQTKRMGYEFEFAHLGGIPFDMDVMRVFAEEGFLYRLRGTMFVKYLIESWNNLAERENLRFIRETFGRPRVGPLFWPILGKFTFKQRISLLYGVLLALTSIILVIYPVFEDLSVYQIAALGTGVVSLFLIFYGLLSRSK